MTHPHDQKIEALVGIYGRGVREVVQSDFYSDCLDKATAIWEQTTRGYSLKTSFNRTRRLQLLFLRITG
jgi:hypothetical protein